MAVAENGRIAVDKARAEPFDVILMDMNMPEMDGYQATRILRGRGDDRPILALTANAMSSDRDLSLAAGCTDHLTKPIDRTRLIHSIAKHVAGRTPGAKPADLARVESAAEQDQAYVSQFANDPDMATILDAFIARLDSQTGAMRESLRQRRFDDLQRLAHRMKGSGGSYGYPLLTDAARSLEEAAKARSHERAAAALEQLLTLCQGIQEAQQLADSAGRTTP